MKKYILALLLIVWSTSLCGETLQDAVNKFVDKGNLKYSSTGISVVEMKSGKEIAAHNSLILLTPASIFKTITCSAALHYLDSDYRYSTEVKLSGNKNNDGVFYGNLIVESCGDPTIDAPYYRDSQANFIESIIKSLKERGIIELKGKIIVTDECTETDAINQEWVLDDVIWSYGAGSYQFNYANNYETIKACADGDSISLLSPENILAFDVTNNCKLTKKGRVEPRLSRSLNSNKIILSGNIKRPKKGATYTFDCAIPNPAQYFITLLQKSFKDNGIGYENCIVPTDEDNEVVILRHQSMPLEEIVKTTLYESDNMYAETILKTIGKEKKKGWNTDESIKLVCKYLKKKNLDVDQLFMYDGSGLARVNKVSAQFMSKMLAKTEKEMKYFSSLLPISGESGTLKNLLKESDGKGKFALKSGSLRNVQCFAGYYPVEKPKYVISIIVNNYTGTRTKLRTNIENLLLDIMKISDNMN